MPVFSVTDWDEKHIANIERVTRNIRRAYIAAIKMAADMGVSVQYDPNEPFFFKNYPQLNARVKKLFDQIATSIQASIIEGMDSGWEIANDMNDALVKSVLKTDKLPDRAIARYMGRNQEGLAAFKKRRSEGLNLSDRIWQSSNQLRSEMEMALQLGIGEGKSADEISKDIRSYLNEPDKLFRRIRETKDGPLRLSQHAKNYHPGQGVYRSSYKNAVRVARNETNLAYRTSDHERSLELDFVVGFEIRLSNRHKVRDMCDDLQGKYPKEFKWAGWHVNCLCHRINILATNQEFNEIELKLLNEEDVSGFVSKNEVGKMPSQFNNWVDENRDRLSVAKSTGYWIKDNFNSGSVLQGLKINLGELKLPDIVYKTRSWASEFQSTSQDIAKDLKVIVTPVNFKSDARIIEKAQSDYKGLTDKVRDIIRNTFISTSDSQNPAIIQQIRKRFNVVKSKTQSADVDAMGYSGTLMQIKNKDGFFAEIQVNSAQMIYAKEPDAKRILGVKIFNQIKKASGLDPGLGHQMYEQYRILDFDNPTQRSKMKELERKSKAYYDKLRSVAL